MKKGSKMSLESRQKMRDLIKGAICLSIPFMWLPFFFVLVHAQVEIQQSQSTDINGARQSIQMENGKTIIKTEHGTLTVIGDHVKYCPNNRYCGPNYVLQMNGTITK